LVTMPSALASSQVEAAPSEPDASPAREPSPEVQEEEEEEGELEPMLCLLCGDAVGGGEVQGGPVPSACACDGGVVHAACVVSGPCSLVVF
jgi:hypothetical protein